MTATLDSKIETTTLHWAGKKKAIQEIDVPSSSVFLTNQEKPLKVSPKANLFIEGDNLDGLKLLQQTHASSVRLVYIDPPYNTGNSFVYQDSFDHSAWLNMMYPRLALARRLLTDDGAIFVSIDDNEVDKLKLVMSEIFGDANFLAQITVKSNPRGRQAEKHFARVHEYLLVFARDASKCNLKGACLTEDQAEEFDLTDSSNRRYRLLGLRQRGAHSLREDRPLMHYPIYVDPETGSISLSKSAKHKVEVLPKKSTGKAGRWMWGAQRTKDSLHLLEAKLIRGRNQWDIFVRDYLNDDEGNVRRRKLQTIWDDKTLNYQNGKKELKDLLGECLVDYPKPTALLRKIIDMVDDEDALFMDFFAGSGTLAHAVLEANAEDGGTRKFVAMQIGEELDHPLYKTIADVCRARMLSVIERLQASTPDFSAGFEECRLTLHRGK